MHLTTGEKQGITALVAEAEARSGAQILTAVLAKADSYPESPWKAFALGAALSALALAALMAPDWDPGTSAILDAGVILGTGSAAALAAVLFPRFARLFIDAGRLDTEAEQFAHALFFRSGLGRTRGRLGILMLVCLFERKVVILADDGYDGRVGEADWQAMADRMTGLLRSRRTAAALRCGVQSAQALLLERGFNGPGLPSEGVPDTPLEIGAQR